MTVRIKPRPHPFYETISNLFRSAPPEDGLVRKHVQIQLTDLTAFPKNTQLLLAHVIQQDNPGLMLMLTDSDADPLLAQGWVNLVPCSTKDVNCFEFIPHVWHQFPRIRDGFLTKNRLVSLQFYRQRKSAFYPWIWY